MCDNTSMYIILQQQHSAGAGEEVMEAEFNRHCYLLPGSGL